MKMVAITLAALAFAAPASAATILDTGLSYPQGGGFGLIRTQAYAAKFTLTEATTITSLEFAIIAYRDLALTYSVYNADIGLPQASPELFSRTINVGATGAPRTTAVGPTGLSLNLGAGNYWLALFAPTSAGVDGELGRTNPNADSPNFIYQGPGFLNAPTWFVGATNVGTFGVRIQGNPVGSVGSVPEPASWAMLIIGFGFVGAAARRRRGNISVAA